MDVEISPLITDKETKTQRGSRICSKAGQDSWQNQSSHLSANSVVVERAPALEPEAWVWHISAVFCTTWVPHSPSASLVPQSEWEVITLHKPFRRSSL